jgi:DNA-binding response OmpR family regulator
MVSRNGAPVGKTALLEQISSEMISAEVLISRLRRKLAKAGVTDLIRTVWGTGYALAEGRTTPAGTNRLTICYAA